MKALLAPDSSLGASCPAKSTATSLGQSLESKERQPGTAAVSQIERLIAAQGPHGKTPDRADNIKANGHVFRHHTKTKLSPGVSHILKKFKDNLIESGVGKIVGLSRKFRMMDQSRDGTLSMAEFKQAIKEDGLDLPEDDVRSLFHFFDR